MQTFACFSKHIVFEERPEPAALRKIGTERYADLVIYTRVSSRKRPHSTKPSRAPSSRPWKIIVIRPSRPQAREQKAMAPESCIQKSPRPGHRLAQIGAWMQLGPFIGLAGTVVGMVRAFDQIHDLKPGSVLAPSDLSSAMGLALYTTAIGLIFATIGAGLVLFAALKQGYRAEWLFWFLIIVGGIYVLLFPVGLIIGVPFLVTALSKRVEFLRPCCPPASFRP